MNDVKVELEEVREESEPGLQAVVAAKPPNRRSWLWIVAGGVAGLLIIALVALRYRPPAPAPPPTTPVPLAAYLGNEYYPDFSPDGSQVVFSWNSEQDNRYHLYVKLMGSPNHLQLTSGDTNDSYPAWSPDGRWIAFVRSDSAGSHTMLISPLGGPERKIGDNLCIGPISWSNDSKWLACPDSQGLVLVGAEGGPLRRLTSPPKPQTDKDRPVFSPDGHSLLFAHCNGTWGCDLDLLELNSDLSPRGRPRRITNEQVASSLGVTWMPDGQDAVWAVSKADPGSSALYRVSVTHPSAIQILSFAESAVYPVEARHRNRLA